MQRRGERLPEPVACTPVDTLVDQLDEFAAAVRGQGRPEVDGETATTALAVVRAGILAAREGWRVSISEVLRSGG